MNDCFSEKEMITSHSYMRNRSYAGLPTNLQQIKYRQRCSGEGLLGLPSSSVTRRFLVFVENQVDRIGRLSHDINLHLWQLGHLAFNS